MKKYFVSKTCKKRGNFCFSFAIKSKKHFSPAPNNVYDYYELASDVSLQKKAFLQSCGFCRPEVPMILVANMPHLEEGEIAISNDDGKALAVKLKVRIALANSNEI